jgi:hypothetical protein
LVARSDFLVSPSLDESKSRAGVTIACLPASRFRDIPPLQQAALVDQSTGVNLGIIYNGNGNIVFNRSFK